MIMDGEHLLGPVVFVPFKPVHNVGAGGGRDVEGVRRMRRKNFSFKDMPGVGGCYRWRWSGDDDGS